MKEHAFTRARSRSTSTHVDDIKAFNRFPIEHTGPFQQPEFAVASKGRKDRMACKLQNFSKFVTRALFFH